MDASRGSIEDKLASEITHLREILTQRLDGVVEGIEKQAVEYERRLRELNESRAEAREKFNDFVDKKLFAAQHDDLVKRNEVNNSQLIALATLPGDIRALFTWREEVINKLGKLDTMTSELSELKISIKGLEGFKQDILEWRSRVLGIAIGVGAVCGSIGGFISHWIMK